MAISKQLLICSFFIASLLLVEAYHQTTGYQPTKIDCGGACEARCRLSSRPHLCKRACGTCCARCSCVPPGTSGNLDTCPCYATMTTHGGKRKCP
ncbi:snakin-2-like [Rutidosis leptorrhynchoides]|uniref:snakin-2-like n=1 Tax=Rutidosis leptorrhynchoides TaxID=125765 RepID=UPI003A996183